MPFEKGRQKTGGRKPGVPNKRTAFVEQLEAQGFDITQEAIRLFHALEDKDKTPLLVKMLEFVFPKRASNEISIEDAQRVLEDDLSAKGFNVGSVVSGIVESVEGNDGSRD